MAFEKILSVSGKSGLYRLVGQMKQGIIVESIEDGKRFPVHGSAKVSALEEISIYTSEEEVPLREVFKKIHEKQDGAQALSHKEDNAKIKAYFESILPDYDKERVYTSDMVKVVRWYNLLIEHKAFDPNEEPTKDGEPETEENVEADEKKPAKKTPKKKPSSAKADTTKAKASSKKAAGASKANTPRKTGGAQRGG